MEKTDDPNPRGGPWVITFEPGERIESKLKKAANVKPSAAQLAWMEMEYTAFVHFGPNTFTGAQWGSGGETVSVYNPAALDVAQWCRTCFQAGMKMIVFTAKHHDGFCLWHTGTTDFSVDNSPCKEDIMAGLRAGCDTYGLKLGVYLSPWDMHQRGRGLWNTERYNQYFLQQLRELLTNYGRIDEVWFDGACGDYEIWKAVPSYSPGLWYDLIHKLQPMAVIRLYDPYSFADDDEWRKIKSGGSRLYWSGKGVRWAGNEGGASRRDEWSVQPVFDRQIAENAAWPDLGQEKYYENAVGAVWYPLEVNTVTLNQWFWNEKTSAVRSLPDLTEVYYNSVGNNGVLLLNVSPDTRGVIGADQAERLTQLKTFIDNTFSVNLAQNAVITASGEAAGHPAGNLIDGNKSSYWSPADSWAVESGAASLTFDLGRDKTFDNVMLREFIQEGQRVAGWSLEAWIDGSWREVIRRKTIGYKNIKRFKAVTTAKVRLNIFRSWDSPMLSGFGLYLSDELPESDAGDDIDIPTLAPSETGPVPPRNGLRYRCFAGGLQSAALLDSVFALKMTASGIAPKIDLGFIGSDRGYSLSYEGYLYIPSDGAYTFQLESADGSLLYIGDNLLLNNDEPHELKAKTRTAIMKHGYYKIKLLYTSFRHSGALRLLWKSHLNELEDISPEYFYLSSL